MKNDRIEKKEIMEKEKISIIFKGASDQKRDVNAWICCSGSFWAFRG